VTKTLNRKRLSDEERLTLLRHTDQEEVGRRDGRVHGRLRPWRAAHGTFERFHVLAAARVESIGAVQLAYVGRQAVRAHGVETRQDDGTVVQVTAQRTSQEVALTDVDRLWCCIHCGCCTWLRSIDRNRSAATSNYRTDGCPHLHATKQPPARHPGISTLAEV